MRNISAFKTNVKSPKVIIVTGNVKRNKIGFTRVLSTAITTTARSAPQNPVIDTPVTTFDTSIRERAEMIRLAIAFIVLVYSIKG